VDLARADKQLAELDILDTVHLEDNLLPHLKGRGAVLNLDPARENVLKLVGLALQTLNLMVGLDPLHILTLLGLDPLFLGSIPDVKPNGEQSAARKGACGDFFIGHVTFCPVLR